MEVDLYFSALNCQLWRCDALQLFCLFLALRAGQDTAQRSHKARFTIPESRPHSIFSAVGPLLTARTRINQNVSCVVDLFVGDHHRGQPFNQASVIDCCRNYRAIPHLRACAQNWPRAGSARCWNTFQSRRWERICAVKAVQKRTSSPCFWLPDKCHM